jgi:hypothetical protein
MAHTFPEGFIPIGDAFAQALEATEDCAPLLRSIDEAKTNDERFGLFDKYDAVLRRVEKRMRSAIADGDLRPFMRGQSGQIEQMVDRKGFLEDRKGFPRESFGVPGIENVPHHLTNPGPDTHGQPVFLSTSNFQKWLEQQRASKHSYVARRGAKTKFDWAAAQEEFRRLMKHHGPLSPDDHEWDAQARIEEAIEKYFEKQLGPDAAPSESMIRKKVSQWLAAWRGQ